MRKPKLIDWTRAWLGERPEYDEQSGDWAIDDMTEAAIDDMPIRYQDEARTRALRTAFAKIADATGRRSVSRKHGRTIYGFIHDLETLFDLRQYCVPQWRQGIGYHVAVELAVSDFLEAHPEIHTTVEEVVEEIRREAEAA